MSLTNVGHVTAAEMAREPRMMHVVAWFDGWGQCNGMPPMDHPRRLTAAEGREWRAGWRAAAAENAEHARLGLYQPREN